jgi:hypothetical protein
MKKAVIYALKSRITTLRNRAEVVESNVCELLNELSAEHIISAPELTQEAGTQLKEHSFRDLSRALLALEEIINEIENQSR